jgi:hypothetical protein
MFEGKEKPLGKMESFIAFLKDLKIPEEKIDILLQTLKMIYFGVYREEGVLEEDLPDLNMVNILLKLNLLEKKKWYSFTVYKCTEKGSEIGREIFKESLNKSAEKLNLLIKSLKPTTVWFWLASQRDQRLDYPCLNLNFFYFGYFELSPIKEILEEEERRKEKAKERMEERIELGYTKEESKKLYEDEIKPRIEHFNPVLSLIQKFIKEKDVQENIIKIWNDLFEMGLATKVHYYVASHGGRIREEVFSAHLELSSYLNKIVREIYGNLFEENLKEILNDYMLYVILEKILNPDYTMRDWNRIIGIMESNGFNLKILDDKLTELENKGVIAKYEKGFIPLVIDSQKLKEEIEAIKVKIKDRLVS